MAFVVYRETKPGRAIPLLEAVLDQALNTAKLQLEILKASKNSPNFLEFIDSFISGFDDDCFSAVIGVVYQDPDNKLDKAFTEWAFEKFFDFLLPGTWDLDYQGETTLDGFKVDFRLHKKVPVGK